MLTEIPETLGLVLENEFFLEKSGAKIAPLFLFYLIGLHFNLSAKNDFLL